MKSSDEAKEIAAEGRREAPAKILVRGARVHNLKNVDVDVPLNCITAVAGVSGSGKSSLALGVLYAEGSRRYLESLSTFTRRKLSQAPKAQVDEVLYVPAAIALHQRPGVPGIRSTFGTATELLNSLRLMFSRLAEHRCPKCGHYHQPTLDVAAEKKLVCKECGNHFYAPSAEDLSFNSAGACQTCGGTGTVMDVDQASLVPDESLSIDQGAVAPWNSLMWSLMTDVVRQMGVRTDVPFRELTPEERDIVFNSPMEKHHILYKPKNGEMPVPLDFTYYSPANSVRNALAKVKDDKGMKRVEKFLQSGACPACHGTRLSEAARAPRIDGKSLDKVCEMTLGDCLNWVDSVPEKLPAEMRPMARSIVESFDLAARRLIDLGLSYLTLDRAASTLSTGERQRVQLARVVRNRTTGVLYVLDEPSIGLHPANIEGLKGVMHDLVDDGNSVLLVDHDTEILSDADWLIEMGPGSGSNGGRVIAEGTIPEIEANPESQIGPFLTGTALRRILPEIPRDEIFANGAIKMQTNAIHTVRPLDVKIPRGRMTVVTGVSGSGKTTMVLESLVAGLQAVTAGHQLPPNVRSIEADGIAHVKLIDSTPIGANVRSTVATYANIHDDLRKIYARQPRAKELGYKAGDFSYNTGRLRCPVCDGTGTISLDVQFLPDVDIPCPECHGSRYAKEADLVRLTNKAGATFSLPTLMASDITGAIELMADNRTVCSRLATLDHLGIGYLTLGEATTSLSGGEAQRLKLASEMGRLQDDSLFVFDEPSIGLHPHDVQTLLRVFEHLLSQGATIVIIEHDLDIIANADWVIDMGPGGGASGGRIVATGTPADIAASPASLTGPYLR